MGGLFLDLKIIKYSRSIILPAVCFDRSKEIDLSRSSSVLDLDNKIGLEI